MDSMDLPGCKMCCDMIFYNTCLQYSNFSECNMQRINLSNVYLAGAIFNNTDLKQCILPQIMDFTKLDCAILDGVKMTEKDFCGTYLTNSRAVGAC